MATLPLSTSHDTAPSATAQEAGAEPAAPHDDGGRSRVTAAARLVLSLWLLWTSGQTLADPPAGAAARGGPIDLVLPLAGLYFSIGLFLLSGFMTRVAGLALSVVAGWEVVNLGITPATVVLVITGLYLVLRGGGTWGMDVYVQKMQERVRRREAQRRPSTPR